MKAWGHLAQTERNMKEGEKLQDVERMLARVLRNRLQYERLLGYEEQPRVNGKLISMQLP